MGRPQATVLHQVEATLEDQGVFGRKGEMRQLIKALTLCATGQGKTMLLTGNEGIGKTTLIRQFIALSEEEYGAKGLLLDQWAMVSCETVYVAIVKAIVALANHTMKDALDTANNVLAPIEMQWSQSDLIQTVALTKLQDSIEGSQPPSAKQLGHVLGQSFPRLKRMGATSRQALETLSELFLDPWVAIAVSLLNPLNTHVSHALTLAAQLEKGEALEQATLEDLQEALAQLLMFINGALRKHSSVFILAFDQWETVAPIGQVERNRIKALVSHLCRQVLDERDCHVMLLVGCRSEQESYALSGPLYNGLRQKFLISPLDQKSTKRSINQALSGQSVRVSDTVLEDMWNQCQGNPGQLYLLTQLIRLDYENQRQETTMDDIGFHSHYGFSNPKDMLDVLFTRLELHFVGKEETLCQQLNRLVLVFANGWFTEEDAQDKLTDVDDRFLADMLKYLVRLGLLELKEASGHYHFVTAFVLSYLLHKTKPIQEDIPSGEKVASLKKILPFAIEAGELTRDKVQDLLSMAKAMGDDAFVGHVETTLLNALKREEVPQASKLGIVESLALFGSLKAMEAVLGLLEHSDLALKLRACEQVRSWADVERLPLPESRIVDALLPLLDDPSEDLSAQAIGLLACWPSERTVTEPILLAKAKQGTDVQRSLALGSLIRLGCQSSQAVELYQQAFQDAEDPALRLALLKGLQQLGDEQLIPILVGYLKNQPLDVVYADVLMVLMARNLRKAVPWISRSLEKSEDTAFKIRLLKQLGSQPHSDLEGILIKYLEHMTQVPIEPELRWVAIRSLGWIGQSKEAFAVLQAQAAWCDSEVLSVALERACEQVQQRLPIGATAAKTIFSPARQPNNVIDLVPHQTQPE